MKFLKRLFAGMAIGVGAAIPGVSGAAIAVIFRVYEEIIHAVNTLRKQFSHSIKVLIPVVLGVIIAVIPCIILFHLAFEYMMFILIALFAGFLLGSLPGITDEVKGKKPTRKQWVIICIAIIFVMLLGVASVFLGPKIQLNATFDVMPWWLYIVLIPVGALAAVALTVPGLSGSLILLVIGFYRPLIDHTTGWGKELFHGSFANTPKLLLMLLCFAIGCIIGVVIVSKLMTLLIKKYHDSTYFAIIGFVVGSIPVLFFNYEIYNYYLYWGGTITPGASIKPLLSMPIEIVVGAIILIVAAIGSYMIVRYSRKYQATKEVNENQQ